MRPVLASFLAFLWVALAQGAFAGQLIVIDSTTPELAPGQILDGSKPLRLAAGARVTLVAEDGQVTTLKGPFSGVPGAGPGVPAGGSQIRSLSQLITGPSSDSSVLAVTRGRAEPADAWAVKLARSVNVCVRVGGTLVLRKKRWSCAKKRAVAPRS